MNRTMQITLLVIAVLIFTASVLFVLSTPVHNYDDPMFQLKGCIATK